MRREACPERSRRVEAVGQATGRPSTGSGQAWGTGEWGSGIRGTGDRTDLRSEADSGWRGAGSGKRMAPEAGSWKLEVVHRVLRYPLFVIC